MFNPILMTTLVAVLGMGEGTPVLVEPMSEGAIAQHAAKQSSDALDNLPLEQTFDHRFTEVQVLVSGQVVSILPEEPAYQRFMLELPNGQQVMVTHNIGLGTPITNLQMGDRVQVFGLYEWDQEGGKISQTYHDPSGQQVDGWVEHDGVLYH